MLMLCVYLIILRSGEHDFGVWCIPLWVPQVVLHRTSIFTLWRPESLMKFGGKKRKKILFNLNMLKMQNETK